MVCKLEDWCVSTLLDPRYKMLQFKNLERWERGTLTKSRAITWAKRAYAADWEPVASEKTSAVATPAIREEQSKLVSFLEDSDEEDEVATGRETPALASEAPTAALVEEDEFALYLALPPASMSENPIAWWVERKDKFPSVFKMARQFLAPPASTAGVERTFSACGMMHSDLRKRLSEGTLEHSMMASINTK